MNTGSMNFKSLFRFRLWHLLLGVVVVSCALWSVTEYGMETAEIEVLRFDTYQDDIEQAFKPLILSGLRFRYLRPQDQRHITAQVFLQDVPVEKDFEIGERIAFRYRAKPLLWLKQDDPNDIALKLLGMKEKYIYQVIVESGDRELEPSTE